MEFLPALRESGIFSRGKKDKPLGMPDIESGNLGSLLRQVVPLVSSLKDDDTRRQKDLMQFESSLRGRSRPMSGGMGKINAPAGPGRGRELNVNAPQGGLTPTQRMFREQDDTEKANRFKSEQLGLDRTGKLSQVMAEGRMRDEGEMNRLIAELNARREMGSEERGSKEKISANELAAKQAESQARLGESAADRAMRMSEGAADRTSREKIATSPSRTPQDPQEQFTAAVQNFKIQNPDLADKVVYDETSKSWKLDTSKMTPEQLATIQSKLKPQSSTASSSAGKVMKRYSPSRNETQVSTDGGKTWKKQ